ncbi:hypothetical protein CTI12_AA106410 [Artemisia annua]|uniref:BED-type domain-containing protein n=1 Tax=Artemisia annua TaxID=35608 RepID=A0A2U1PVZ9_ARTAN|nr:hypothetical protein CTI12_AA106410 [Artemisia annua]
MDSENHSDARSRDPGWKYATKGSTPGTVICNFCQKITYGGIYRAKQHLAGGYRNSKGCNKCPAHVREEIKEYFRVFNRNKRIAEVLPDFDEAELEEYVYDEDEEVGSGSHQGSSRKFQAHSSKKQKDSTIEDDPQVSAGLLDCVMRLVPNEDDQSKLMAEKRMYKDAEGILGYKLAIRDRNIKSPGKI